jgi:hypothetical protein
MPARARRTDTPRFSVHDAVRINNVIWSPHAGQSAIVLTVDANRVARTLDKYQVLVGAAECTVWDIQLMPIEPGVTT